MGRLLFLGELFTFALQRKRWWLTPIIVTLLLVGILIIVGEATALAPFIYPVF